MKEAKTKKQVKSKPDRAPSLPTIQLPQQKKSGCGCGTCFGFGLWAIGDPSPMGPMDAADGMPTDECPECGKSANPIELPKSMKKKKSKKK